MDLTFQTSNFVVRVCDTSVSTSVSQIQDILYRFFKNLRVSYVTLRNLHNLQLLKRRLRVAGEM